MTIFAIVLALGLVLATVLKTFSLTRSVGRRVCLPMVEGDDTSPPFVRTPHYEGKRRVRSPKPDERAKDIGTRHGRWDRPPPTWPTGREALTGT